MFIVFTYLSAVVGQYPREDRVLHEVIVRSSSKRVEVHQVLEVGDLSILQQ